MAGSTTAAAIEDIGNAALFELLCIQVLRQLDQDSRLIVHTGLNAQGKTIPAPVDGFVRVAHSVPTHYVMHQFTTIGRTSLKEKWLNETEGDITKATAQASRIRISDPDARFTLWLCTNQRLDSPLMESAYALGTRNNVEIRFLDQSNLRDHLDNTSEGQWLRREHLGITAVRVSRPLLLQLAARNAQAYGGESIFLSPDRFVATSTLTKLRSAARSSGRLCLLIGRSGSGKSVLAYQYLAEHLRRGEIGFRITGEALVAAGSLSEALGRTVAQIQPDIEIDAGNAVLRCCDEDHPLLVVVDDINRCENPAVALRKLMRWAAPASDKQGVTCRIICPIWEQHWSPEEMKHREIEWLTQIWVPPMQSSEAVACLRAALADAGARFTDTDLERIATRLGFDPILLAMLARRDARDNLSSTIASYVVADFVRDAVNEAATQNKRPAVEYENTLHALADWILVQRKLYPLWDDVCQHFGSAAAALTCLRELVAADVICRVVQEDGDSRFRFRHDRILGDHLVKALARRLSTAAADAEVLSEPFYTQYLGRALVESGSLEILPWVVANAPVALFAAFSHFDGRKRSIEEAILSSAREWLTAAVNVPSLYPLLHTAAEYIEDVDSPDVLAVTAPVATDYRFLQARIANGDVAAAVRELHSRTHFPPSIQFTRRDNAIARGLRRHRSKMMSELITLLRAGRLGDLKGALVLAGFIGDPVLGREVQSVWLAYGSDDLLLYALWAALRCSTDDPKGILDPVLKQWMSLPEKKDPEVFSRQTVLNIVDDAMRHGMPTAVLSHLTDLGRSSVEWRSLIMWLLIRTDDPVAVTFLNEIVAEAEAKKPDGGFSWVQMQVRDAWSPGQLRGKQLSLRSLDCLKSIWSTTSNANAVRKAAFQTWVKAVNDVDALKAVPREQEGYDSALWHRCRLGDKSVVEEILLRVPLEAKWIRILHSVWHPAFVVPIDAALGTLAPSTPTDFSGGDTYAHHDLAELLRDIPVEASEPLLWKHWDQLKYSHHFFQLALYLGTPEAKRRVDAVLRECPTPKVLFEHVHSLFGIFTQGLAERLHLEQIEYLLSFSAQLSSMTLWEIMHFSENAGHLAWAKARIESEYRRRLPEPKAEKTDMLHGIAPYFTTESDLISELNEIESKDYHELGLDSWVERSERYHGTKAVVWSAFDQWLATGASPRRFQMLIRALLNYGTRKELRLLRRDLSAATASEQAVRATEFYVKHRSLD